MNLDIGHDTAACNPKPTTVWYIEIFFKNMYGGANRCTHGYEAMLEKLTQLKMQEAQLTLLSVMKLSRERINF